VIDKYSLDLLGHGTIIQLEKWLTRSEEPTAEFRHMVHNTFSVLMDLARDNKLNSVFNRPRKMSPIEFIMVVVLIAVHKDKLNLSQLSAAIAQMRVDVRDKHQDIRMNSRVGRTMIEFIQGLESSSVKAESGESAGLLTQPGKKRGHFALNMDKDVTMDPPSTLHSTSRGPDGDSTSLASEIVPKKTTIRITDRLAAIRNAKDKLSSKPVILPPLTPAVLCDSVDSMSPSTKQAMEINALESALMERMNSDVSPNRTGAHCDGDNRSTRSRHSSSRDRSRSRGRDLVHERPTRSRHKT